MPDVAGYHLCWCSFKAEKNAGRVSSITARGVCEMSGHEMVAYGQ